MRANFSNADEVSATALGAVTLPGELKHLRTHPAIEPQSLVFFSQGLP
jgi:hypothetical protein